MQLHLILLLHLRVMGSKSQVSCAYPTSLCSFHEKKQILVALERRTIHPVHRPDSPLHHVYYRCIRYPPKRS